MILVQICSDFHDVKLTFFVFIRLINIFSLMFCVQNIMNGVSNDFILILIVAMLVLVRKVNFYKWVSFELTGLAFPNMHGS